LIASISLSPGIVLRGEVGGEAIDYSIRLMDLDGCKPFAIVRRHSRRVVVRRLRASAEETPPNAFYAKIDHHHRAIIKRASTRTRFDPPARRAHYFFTPNESASARTTREVRGFI
jgi:hypothetical protein